MKKKFSPYTIACNCTDLADINAGIHEIEEAYQSGNPVPYYCANRLNKLQLKKQKLIQAQYQSLSVNISIRITPVIVRQAIKECLLAGTVPDSQTILTVIRNRVRSKGMDGIKPEVIWNDNSNAISDDRIENAFQRIKNNFFTE